MGLNRIKRSIDAILTDWISITPSAKRVPRECQESAKRGETAERLLRDC